MFLHILCVLFFQFSLRSRTPSLSGSIYSPYSSRKVSSSIFVFFFFVIVGSFDFLNVMKWLW